jgi:RNA polymerase sigma-70 factor, ECF subfamily
LRRVEAGATIWRLPPLPRYAFDREYVQRLIDEDAPTERHFTKYFGDLLTLKLSRRLRSAAQVEDVRQETFARVLTALKQKGTLTSPEGLGAFVNSVCNNVLFELYRSSSRTTPLEDDHDPLDRDTISAESSVIRTEERQRVHRALQELPAKDQELLRWLFFEERDKDDVCRELNVDRSYLRVLLHRAKGRFRERFEE